MLLALSAWCIDDFRQWWRDELREEVLRICRVARWQLRGWVVRRPPPAPPFRQPVHVRVVAPTLDQAAIECQLLARAFEVADEHGIPLQQAWLIVEAELLDPKVEDIDR